MISSIFIVELVGSILTNSLALLGDAGHMLTDLFALFLSFIAVRLATRPPTKMRTLGFYPFEILAVLFNGVLLVFIAGHIFYRSYHRLLKPEPVLGIARRICSARTMSVKTSDIDIRGSIHRIQVMISRSFNEGGKE